jgi:hypothetical protein
MINMKMIRCFQGDEMVYHSFDSVVDDPHNYYVTPLVLRPGLALRLRPKGNYRTSFTDFRFLNVHEMIDEPCVTSPCD